MPAWRAVDGGVELAVRAMPRSSREGIEGLVTEADGSCWLAVRVAAVAEGGKANRALIAVLASGLCVNRSALTLVFGQTGRRKRLKIAGDSSIILSALEKLAS